MCTFKRTNTYRLYDPGTGRFLSEDPIGPVSGDINLYRMVMNNPVTKFDPYGLYNMTAGGQPAQTYDSREKAAQSILGQVNQYSIDNNVEVGGYIYKKEGGYGYSSPVVGNKESVNIKLPKGEAIAGIYHTHAGESEDYISEDFSEKDLSNARSINQPSYLMTPNNQFKTYDPRKGSKKCPFK